MSMKSLILSSAGLKNISHNINSAENDFLLIFGNEEIRLNKINADFISPLISNLHRSDPTMNMYKYPPDESLTDIFNHEIVNKLKLLCNGESIEVDHDESKKLRVISNLLHNEELSNKLEELFPVSDNEFNFDEILKEQEIIEYSRRQGFLINEFKGHIIDSIASNFYKLQSKEIEHLVRLPIDFLYSIVTSDKLKLKDEDSLFDFISQIKNFESANIGVIEFCEYVEIENLSLDKFREMISIINENNMTHAIWNQLKKYLVSHFELSVNKTVKSARYIKDETAYDGSESGAFKGIISHLTAKCGGNVMDKNVIDVTSSSAFSNHLVGKNVVDFDTNNYFESNNLQNSWLKFDFKLRKVRPTHYSIRTSHDHDKGAANLQHWVIEGSNTDRDDDWKILDSRNNITVLDGKNKVHTFEIQEKLGPNECFRYLRLRQTGSATGGFQYLIISALEYFGELI